MMFLILIMYKQIKNNEKIFQAIRLLLESNSEQLAATSSPGLEDAKSVPLISSADADKAERLRGDLNEALVEGYRLVDDRLVECKLATDAQFKNLELIRSYYEPAEQAFVDASSEQSRLQSALDAANSTLQGNLARLEAIRVPYLARKESFMLYIPS